jgi:hypothetical protein
VWKQFALHYYAATRNVAQTALAVGFFEHDIKHWAIDSLRYDTLDMTIYESILELPRFQHFRYVQAAARTDDDCTSPSLL